MGLTVLTTRRGVCGLPTGSSDELTTMAALKSAGVDLLGEEIG